MSLLKSKNYTSVIIILVIFIIIVIISIYPNVYMQSTTKGIYTWANVILPSLLPFFFFTKILSMMSDTQSFTKVFNKPINKLYNCPSIASYISIMSIISGYPVGAKLTSEFYKNHLISSNQAHRIISFCSTSGPLFIIGSVGSSLLGDKTCGILIFISHVISSLLNGLIYRRYKLDNSASQSPLYQQNNNILNDSMYNTINSVMMVGGFIAISFVVIDIINNLNLLSPALYVLDNIFGLSNFPNLSKAIVNGIMEVTHGCVDLSIVAIKPYLCSIIACGLISFGGLSVHLQSIVFLTECKIKYKYFLLTKITHSLLSIGVCALLGLFIL